MAPVPVGSVVWSVLLLGGCLIVDVSGQTTIMSSLQSTNRMYVCPGEIVTYVCSGVGNEIRLSAPPHIPSTVPLSYVRGDTLGTGFIRDGSIVTNLISTDLPLMVADLIVQNSSLPELSVRCTVLLPSTQAVVQHKRSDPPSEINSAVIRDIGGPSDAGATVEVTWNRTDGNYDLSHYTVQLFVNSTETVTTVISAERNSSVAVFFVPFNTTVTVNATITVTSKCGQTTTGISTGIVTITQNLPAMGGPTVVVEVFLGILSVVSFILVIVVIVLGVCLCCLKNATDNC